MTPSPASIASLLAGVAEPAAQVPLVQLGVGGPARRPPARLEVLDRGAHLVLGGQRLTGSSNSWRTLAMRSLARLAGLGI